MRSTLRCCLPTRDARSADPLGERRPGRIPALAVSSTSATDLEAEAAEDGEGVCLLDLVDELAAGLHLAVEAARERVGVLAARGADHEIPEAALGPVALLPEPLG